MAEVNIHEAKTQPSRLLRRVAAGEAITIAKSGRPIARLVPIEKPAQRLFGADKGLFNVPEDFDDSLPGSRVRDFER